MTQPTPSIAYVCYSYDGDEDTMIINVEGCTREEKIAHGERQAQDILEEGISFDILLPDDAQAELV